MSTRTRLLLTGLAIFAVLSVTDFIQTYALISGSDGAVYEANPVANAWLERHGWNGLAAFKVGVVLVFTATAVLITLRRPRAGAGVIALGCAALLVVTLYSHQLLARSEQHRREAWDAGVVRHYRVIPRPIHPGWDGVAPQPAWATSATAEAE